MLDRGKLAVLTMFAVALAAAAFAWWWNYSRGQKCLAFYGADAALLIRTAKDVELIELSPESDRPEDPAVDRMVVNGQTYLFDRITTISQAKGLIHARASIVDDTSFRWDAQQRDCASHVPYAIRFLSDDYNKRATLAFDFGCRRVWYVEQQKSVELIPKVAEGWESFLSRLSNEAKNENADKHSSSHLY
jgi:hypothetical protein